ncbi:hypothetical protein O9929_12970 [Vibrio lentus]|nr:hypothetical protein [Vibrio lentus]
MTPSLFVMRVSADLIRPSCSAYLAQFRCEFCFKFNDKREYEKPSSTKRLAIVGSGYSYARQRVGFGVSSIKMTSSSSAFSDPQCSLKVLPF